MPSARLTLLLLLFFVTPAGAQPVEFTIPTVPEVPDARVLCREQVVGKANAPLHVDFELLRQWAPHGRVPFVVSAKGYLKATVAVPLEALRSGAPIDPVRLELQIQNVTFHTDPAGATISVKTVDRGWVRLDRPSGEPNPLTRSDFGEDSFEVSFEKDRWKGSAVVQPSVWESGRWPLEEGSAIGLETDSAVARLTKLARDNPVIASAGGLLLVVLAAVGLRLGLSQARDARRLRTLNSLAADSEDPMIKKVLGSYRLIDRLGAGGMATVYKAVPEDTLDESRAVAVKVMQKEMADDEEFRRRFEREVRVSKELLHPNIVMVEEWGDEDGFLYLALEFIDGQTLDKHIPSRGLDLQEAMPYLEPMLEALIYAHGKGVVHRDLKPENVMVTGSGRPKIMDFGLARSNDVSKVTRTGSALGTPAYMPPEQITGAPPTPAADQYAFGVMLYEMLTGRRPFDDPDPMATVFKHMTEQPPSPREFQPSLSEGLEALVLRMLEKDPARRFPSLKAVLEGLRALASGEDWSVPPAAVPRAKSQPAPPPAPPPPAVPAQDGDGTLAFTASSIPVDDGTIQFQTSPEAKEGPES